MMKKQFLIPVSILLCFFIFSGFFKSKTEKYIEAGDNALMRGNYETAYENYRKAGEKAELKLHSAYMREIRTCKELTEYSMNARPLEDILDNIEEKETNQRLYKDVLLDLVALLREEKKSTEIIQSVIDRIPAAYQEEANALEKDFSEEQLRKKQEALDESIRIANSNSYADYTWDNVLEECRAMPDYAPAQEVLKQYEAIKSNPCPETAKDVTPNFWKYATKGYEAKTLNDTILFRMGEETVDQRYHPEMPDTTTLDAFYDPNSTSIMMGIDHTEAAQTLTATMVEELKAGCGTAADGKVLIIHNRAVYNSKERETDIIWHLMRKLPDSRKPLNVEEVKYLIYLQSDYSKGGTYSGGTQQIIERTKLSLYDTESGKVLFTKTVSGKRSDVMYYTKYKPAYYSAESPDMCAAFRDAMKKINNLTK